MSSTDKIQLKKLTPSDVGTAPSKDKGGRPRKISDPVAQKKLLIELLDKLEGITREDGRYVLQRDVLNCLNNVNLLKINVFEIKKVFPGCEYARRMGNKFPVYTLLKQLSKILKIKFERVSFSSSTEIEYRIYI